MGSADMGYYNNIQYILGEYTKIYSTKQPIMINMSNAWVRKLASW